jgi:ribosomal protein L35AE/L33A
MDSLQGRVGSGDQRNTLWGTVEWEGDRYGTHGTSGLIRAPESGPLAAMETGTVVEQDRLDSRSRWALTLAE